MCSFLLPAKIYTKRTNSHLADVALQKWHEVSGYKIQSAVDGAEPAMGKVLGWGERPNAGGINVKTLG